MINSIFSLAFNPPAFFRFFAFHLLKRLHVACILPNTFVKRVLQRGWSDI